jgi:hypothetical protein
VGAGDTSGGTKGGDIAGFRRRGIYAESGALCVSSMSSSGGTLKSLLQASAEVSATES